MVTRTDLVVYDSLVRLLEVLERHGIHGADRSSMYEQLIDSIYLLVRDCYGEGPRQSQAGDKVFEDGEVGRVVGSQRI